MADTRKKTPATNGRGSKTLAKTPADAAPAPDPENEFNPSPEALQAEMRKKNSGKDEPAEAALSSRRIVIPEFSTAWRRLILRGTTPILTNAVSDRVLDQIAFQQGGGKVEKKPRDPHQEYFEHHHICFGKADPAALKDNLYGFPAVGIKKALVQTIGMMFTRSVASQVSPWIFVNGPYNGLVPFLRKAVDKPSHEEFLKNRAVSEMRRDPTYLFKMGQGKILTPCYRPMFMPWFATLDVRYNPDVLNETDLLRAFKALGTLTTFGSYRRSRGGDFGEFAIERAIALPDDYAPAAKWGSNG